MLLSSRKARAMYPGGRADPTARRLASWWASYIAGGWMPKRWVTLEVPGRCSGQIRRFPLGMADVAGEWFLVSMLGPDCHWVRNVRAASGRVVLTQRRRSRPCRLVEVPVERRAAILRRYVAKVPGGRPHIPVDRNAPLDEFAAIAERYPVFKVVADRADPGEAR